MRDLHDTLTRGGFRDDTHRAAVEAAAVDLAPGHLGEPVAAFSGGLATHTHAGASEAAQRAPQGPRTFTIQTSTAHDPIGAYISFIEDEGDVALHGVCAIYDAATRALAAAGPLPLASTEPWAQSDQAYRARLADYLGYDVTYSGSMLDDYGVEAAELPRARLVPASTMQGGADG